MRRVFQVTWSVTVEAEDVREAVWRAKELQADIYENVFEVTEQDGKTVYYDLLSYGRVRNPADRRE